MASIGEFEEALRLIEMILRKLRVANAHTDLIVDPEIVEVHCFVPLHGP